MGWQAVPQIMGLTRGEPRPGQKHRANGLGIAQEAGPERYSRSETLDRSRSALNVYTGYETGAECWAAMVEDADAYRVPVRRKGHATAYRTLPGDAVIGWAVIAKPPAEVCADWTPEQHAKFARDTMDILAELCPRVFGGRRRLQAWHLDEDGIHSHTIGDAIDADGRYCGNLIDAKLLNRINREYPAKMRARGWVDMEDVNAMDWDRMGNVKDEDGKPVLDAQGRKIPVDPEYRAERKRKRKEGGKSVNEYHRAKELDKRAAELQAQAKELQALKDELSARETGLQAREEAHARKVSADEQKALQAAQDAREREAKLEERDRAVTTREGKLQAVLDELGRAIDEAKDARRSCVGVYSALMSHVPESSKAKMRDKYAPKINAAKDKLQGLSTRRALVEAEYMQRGQGKDDERTR